MITDCIVVGMDDSAASRATHRWAAAYANATGKELRAVNVLDWPIGLITLAVKSGTRLHVPQQDVAETYWRGMHRVFDETISPQGSVLQFAQGDPADVLMRLSTYDDLLVSSAPGNRGEGPSTRPAPSATTASATPVVQSSRFPR